MSNSTMPARVAAIKAAIESRQDFTGLAHGGEGAVVAWARTHGLNGRGLILEWQATYRDRQAMAARATTPVGFRLTARQNRETEFRAHAIWITGVTPSQTSRMMMTTATC